jgi:uncharacterized protein YcfJ
MNKKAIFLFIHLLAYALTLISCSSVPPKVYVGGILGAGIGTALGHQVDGTDQSRIIGALVGAGIGTLIASTAGSNTSEKTSQKPNKPIEDEFPELSSPKLRSIWVPDKIEGNKYIKGHQIYIIEDPGTWQKK